MYVYTVILLLDYTHLQSSVEMILYLAAVMVALTLITFTMLYGSLPRNVKMFLPMYIFFASIILFVVRRSLPILLESGVEMTSLALSMLLLLPFMAVSQSRIYCRTTEMPLEGEMETAEGGSLANDEFPLKKVFNGKLKYIYSFALLFWGVYLSHSFPLLFLVMIFIMLVAMGSAFFVKGQGNPLAMGVGAILLVQGFLLGSIVWVVLAIMGGVAPSSAGSPFTVPMFDIVAAVSGLAIFAAQGFIVTIHVTLIGLVYVLKGRNLIARVYNSFAFAGVTALSFVATFMFTRGEIPLFLHLVLLYVYMLSFFAIGRAALDFDTLITKKPLMIIIFLVCIGLGSGMVGLIPWEWYHGAARV